MPQLLKFSEQHAKAEDATVFTVVYDPTDRGALKTYLATRGAQWPAVNDPAASVPYGVTDLPSSFLVAPDGIVYAYMPGGVTAAELDSYIQQGAQRASARLRRAARGWSGEEEVDPRPVGSPGALRRAQPRGWFGCHRRATASRPRFISAPCR